MKRVSVLDIGLGNIQCVLQAFEYLGHKVTFLSEAEKVKTADLIVFPGVGAFGDGMKKLGALNLIEPLREHVKAGKPLLGICLGMQLFLSKSFEFGEHDGLDYIAGEVLPLRKPVPDDEDYHVPHIGWNDVVFKDCPTHFAASANNADYYFCHSYYAQLEREEQSLACCTYGKQEFCAAIVSDNIIGFQFHPEKSGKDGLALLKRYCKATGA